MFFYLLVLLRWWALFELFCFLFREFKRLIDFVESSADPIGTDETATINGARITRLRATIANLEKRAFLHLELGVVKIVCTPLIETTYTLEGDSCVALITYDKLQEMYNYLDTYTGESWNLLIYVL